MPPYAVAAALLLTSCGTEPELTRLHDEQIGEARGWSLLKKSDGAILAYDAGTGTASMRLICLGGGRFWVNVPAFRPIGSEERMTFGQGASVETLVADPAGDSKLDGVTAAGTVPERLAALLSGRIAVNYGSQNSGPHPQIPKDLIRRFIANCPPADKQAMNVNREEAKVSACFVKDGKRVPDINLGAIGTEPFWRAEIKGRCIIYKTPENQEGTRIWAEFYGSRDSGIWTGYYENRRFVLRTHPDQNCSDGMSDRIYPVGVSLVVDGGERTGCADYR